MINKMISSTYDLIIAAEECTQSFRYLEASYNAIKNRYHPLVWMFIRIYWFFRQ